MQIIDFHLPTGYTDRKRTLIPKEGRNVAAKNKVKPDIILKDFWRDNDRFADLFNGALFGGEKVLKPELLQESDTDISSIIKLDSYAETLGRLLDVVKKSAYGVDFVIFGLENQMKVHYAMPLRNMTGDTLIYLKEYAQIVKENKKAKAWDNRDEFLSGFRKENRLRPVVTLCVYYGENAWDGPLTLMDMLDMQSIPEQLTELVNNYKMHFVQVLDSDRCSFQNQDVYDFFEILRSIYRRDYQNIQEVYGSREISAELGLVIGAAAESESLINKALQRKGGGMNMCTALQELENKGRNEGRIEGRNEGRIEGRNEGRIEGKIEGIVKTCLDFGAPQAVAEEKLQQECGLNRKDARQYVIKYYTDL